MTIYWQPDDETDPNSIDVWHVLDDGTQINIGPVDVSDVKGMPDSLGGIAPDAVRRAVAEYRYGEMSPGNAPSHSQASAQASRDMDDFDYVRGAP